MQKQKTIFIYIAITVGVFGLLFSIFSFQEDSSNNIIAEEDSEKKELVITNFQEKNEFIINDFGKLGTDESDFVIGNKSLKITTDGDGNPVVIKKNGVGPLDFNGKFLKVWLKVSNRNNIDKLNIFVSADDYNTYKTYWISKNNISPSAFYLRDNQWNPLTISLTQTSDKGIPDISEINSISISVTDNKKSPVSVWFNSISLVESTSSGVVSFTFDDAILSQYTNANPILAKYEYPATAYVPTNLIGTKNKMTVNQLRELQDVYGWDISSHTKNHMDLTNENFESEFEGEIAGSQKYLVDNGLQKGAEHFAYAFGKFDNENANELIQKYYKTARTVRGDIETFPVADPYRLRVQYIFNDTSPEEVSQRVKSAMENGDWLILVFHGIVKSNANNRHLTYLQSNFEHIVEDINKQGIDVMTISEVYESKLQK